MIGLITSRIAGPLMGAVAMALGVMLMSSWWTISDLRGQVSDTTKALSITQSTLQTQSLSLETLAAEGKARTAAVAKALAGLQSVASEALVTRERVLAATPQTCQELDDLLMGTIRR